ncbi:MAG TPA: triose-phosphate isomerase, partial [Candidatus Paceibacterota bacterium]
RAKELAANAKRLANRSKHIFVLAPSSPHLGLFPKAGKRNLQFAAQDVSEKSGGAATGEVPASLLRELGVGYVILGHSERRALGETDAEIAAKTKQALAAGLVPILCIGERERDEDAKYVQVLRTELSAVLEVLSPKERTKIVIAYEPIWAIGKSARDAITPVDLKEMVLYIRKILAQHVPKVTANKVKIIYGGSVEPGNIRELAKEGGVDGFLIGHASVDPKTFSALVKELS